LITVDSFDEEPEEGLYAQLSDDDYVTMLRKKMAYIIEEKIKESLKFTILVKEIYFSYFFREEEHCSLRSLR
jgi:hypothetical protein